MHIATAKRAKTSDHSWYRRYWRDCDRSHGNESQDLPIRARLCCLDRTGPTANVNRRKTEARADIQQGDRYLRRILVVGAVSTLRRGQASLNPERYPWVTRLLARRPFKVVAVALANKMARIGWALLIGGKTCGAAQFAAA